MSEKKLTELSPEELEKAIKAGDTIVDDRSIPDGFENNEGE